MTDDINRPPPQFGKGSPWDKLNAHVTRGIERLPSREEMDDAAARLLGRDAKVETIQEQSMRWASEMTRKVAAEKEAAIVNTIICTMLAARLTRLDVHPRDVLHAQDYVLERYEDPATASWVFELKRRGS